MDPHWQFPSGQIWSGVGAEESRCGFPSVKRPTSLSLSQPSYGQTYPPEPWLLKRWKVVCRAVDGLCYDVPVAGKPTPHVSVWCIRVEVSDVVRVYVRFYDAGAVGEDLVW